MTIGTRRTRSACFQMDVCDEDNQWDDSGEALKISIPLYETVNGLCGVCGEDNQCDDSGEEKILEARRRRSPLRVLNLII